MVYFDSTNEQIDRQIYLWANQQYSKHLLHLYPFQNSSRFKLHFSGDILPLS